MTRKDPNIERGILKSHVSDYEEKAISGIGTGVPQPIIQEPYPQDALVIDLPIVWMKRHHRGCPFSNAHQDDAVDAITQSSL